MQSLHRLGYVHRDLKPDNIVLKLNPLEVRIIDFDRSRLTTDTSKPTALGTHGYFPIAMDWRDGYIRWDVWAIVAMLCEADMQKDEYLPTKGEKDAKQKIIKHLSRPSTCRKLKEIVEETISLSKKDHMIDLAEVERLVLRLKF